MAYPDLGDWNSRRPNEAQDDACDTAELLAWTAIDQLTVGRVAFEPIVVRPTVLDANNAIALDGPVGGVVKVVDSGVTISPTTYRVDPPNLLVSLDAGVWNVNGDMTQKAGESGVVEVTYYQGWRPGRLLIWAAGELAAEFYAAASGKKCRLPSNVTAVTRQGVSFTMQTPLFGSGRTGIHEIDVVIGRYNPQRVAAPALVMSVESLANAPRRVLPA